MALPHAGPNPKRQVAGKTTAQATMKKHRELMARRRDLQHRVKAQLMSALSQTALGNSCSIAPQDDGIASFSSITLHAHFTISVAVRRSAPWNGKVPTRNTCGHGIQIIAYICFSKYCKQVYLCAGALTHTLVYNGGMCLHVLAHTDCSPAIAPQNIGHMHLFCHRPGHSL